MNNTITKPIKLKSYEKTDKPRHVRNDFRPAFIHPDDRIFVDHHIHRLPFGFNKQNHRDITGIRLAIVPIKGIFKTFEIPKPVVQNR